MKEYAKENASKNECVEVLSMNVYEEECKHERTFGEQVCMSVRKNNRINDYVKEAKHEYIFERMLELMKNT